MENWEKCLYFIFIERMALNASWSHDGRRLFNAICVCARGCVCVRMAVCARCRQQPKERFAQWKLRAVTRVSAFAAISRGLFSPLPFARLRLRQQGFFHAELISEPGCRTCERRRRERLRVRSVSREMEFQINSPETCHFHSSPPF